MAGLKTYHAKRDFRVTAEPRGRIARGKSKARKFVVQRHDATRLHFDLRLELDGVYKSWAVTKVPSLDPATKRLAVEVEDHPLDYGTFEGTIPEGQYGGGTVQLWDRGTWTPASDDPQNDFAKGHIAFTLKGERLKGGWALIRMRDAKTRPGRKIRHNWLLIKERDKDAKPGKPDTLLAADTSVKTGRTLDEIAGASVAGVAISHPDKELWPASKTGPAITKLDLALYLEKAAPRILPYIKGRPLSLVRAPDGIEGAQFFQRHVSQGMGPAIKTIKVKGQSKPFLMVDSIEGLVELAQAGVLEFHPWGNKRGDLETPAILVFDLDPAPGVPFDDVTAAAKDISARLKPLGLMPFVKTTGGKGLHVETPIKAGPLGWKEAKDFCRTFCEMLAREKPERYTIAMAKTKRGGKIFLDYLRNDRMATSVAPWSPRAREGATIACPIPLRALKPGLDPKAYTIANADRILSRPDPWADIDAAATPLEIARKRLALALQKPRG